MSGPAITRNRYGKSGIRVVKVLRDREPHEIVDLTIDVQLEGAFDAVYMRGDNSTCLATDTMKNTVYAFAREDRIDHVEPFAARLASHFVRQPAVLTATVSAVEHRWDPQAAGGQPHPHVFVHAGAEAWTTAVTCERGEARVRSGLTNLALMKTADSAFSGFPRDPYTTLPETSDRILATAITACWSYRDLQVDFRARGRIRTALVETFAAHHSQSVQHTLYAMGAAALAVCPDVDEITLTMPNRHHVLADLTPFGLDNPNEIFVATDRPFGLIEATLRR